MSAAREAMDPIEFRLDEGLTQADLRALKDLRDRYLARSEGGEHSPLEQGWFGPRELALYDATFGARIGWKWRAVLKEVALRAITPPRGTILDWGCGTGVASRAWIEAHGPEGQSVLLWDASHAAQEFAAQKLRARWPALDVQLLHAPPPAAGSEAPDVLLASHVLSELDDPAFDALVDLAAKARFVTWVEPGSHAISRRLILARERLRGAADGSGDELAVLAPCTHANICGLLAANHARDWCHHLAQPAPEAFTTRLWNQVARELGIDLRSLPYSFLVMGRGERREPDPRDARILGRPRVEKGRALLDVCREDGVSTLRFLERMDKVWFRRLQDAPEQARLHRIEDAEGRVERLDELPVPPPWRAAEDR